MNTTYTPYRTITYSYTTSYSGTSNQTVYITYDRDVSPKPDRELEIGDTKLLDEFLKGFGVK